jgi:hypothetical protein
MLIPPGYASVFVEEICHPQFEDLELDIPGGDGERTLKDAVHGIILWPKRYIVIPPTDPRSPSRPSISPRSPSTQEPLFNSGGASSSHDIHINPESPPKKQKNQWRQSKRHQKHKKHRNTIEKTTQP